MELAQYLRNAAQQALMFEQGEFPRQLSGTDFYVAKVDDKSVIAHGEIIHEGASYKIGPLGQFTENYTAIEIPQYIQEMATIAVEQGRPLPVLISESADFFLAEETDETVRALYGFESGGKSYKIGLKK